MPISTTSSVNVLDPTGGASPWSVATINTLTVTNPLTNATATVQSVLFELRPATPGAYGGAIQADYLVGSNGAISPLDQVFFQPNGSVTSVYLTNEALNPLLTSSGVQPANAGYAHTQYNYTASTGLTQVIATDIYGRTYVGV